MDTLTLIPIGDIRPGNNDRVVFNQALLDELSQSIRAEGLLNPIVVEPKAGETPYAIIAGERRWRACKLAGLVEVPCIIRAVTERQSSMLTLLENVSRENLGLLEEAHAYQDRLDAGMTVEDLARSAGVSSNRIRLRTKLLTLPERLQQAIDEGILGLGYAQILADAEIDAEKMWLAFGKLRDNSSPTTAWFRKVAAELEMQQSQGELFDGDFTATTTVLFDVPQDKEPALPGRDTPPAAGGSPLDVLRSQEAYWRNAGEKWDGRGKSGERQRCFAAADALRGLLRAFGDLEAGLEILACAESDGDLADAARMLRDVAA